MAEKIISEALHVLRRVGRELGGVYWSRGMDWLFGLVEWVEMMWWSGGNVWVCLCVFERREGGMMRVRYGVEE